MKNNKISIFNEETLEQKIIKTWGKYGAHYDIFKMMLDRIKPVKKFDNTICLAAVCNNTRYKNQLICKKCWDENIDQYV